MVYWKSQVVDSLVSYATSCMLFSEWPTIDGLKAVVWQPSHFCLMWYPRENHCKFCPGASTEQCQVSAVVRWLSLPNHASSLSCFLCYSPQKISYTLISSQHLYKHICKYLQKHLQNFSFLKNPIERHFYSPILHAVKSSSFKDLL